ncbi:hypothetical protein BDQ12DRAFT_673660 [Crucibulum laeve]|uniref:DUF6533 domain-containing protein n=1 Tax=Crucibulum laeve TaxID=68775 RepID=A0A5C3MHE7_9AGAR|nr:hypothetical protein BDQ12DRAFT_673660 [Crucibulum laeve]
MEWARVASYAGMALNIYDLFDCFSEEIEYIWGTTQTLRILKHLYFVSRYFPLVLHLQFSYYTPLLGCPVSLSDPSLDWARRIWGLYKFLTLQVLICIVDVTVLIRLYLISNSKRWLLAFLAALVGFRIVLAGWATLFVSSMLKSRPHPTCRVPTAVSIYYLAGELLVQGVLLVLTFGRSFVILEKEARRSYVASRMLDQGVAPLVTVIALMFCIFIQASSSYADLIYPFFTAAVSILGTRLIIHMHKVSRPPQVKPVEDTQ